MDVWWVGVVVAKESYYQPHSYEALVIRFPWIRQHMNVVWLLLGVAADLYHFLLLQSLVPILGQGL